ncbi:MAG: TIGR00730 family Rossman fold protein [Bacteroidales bacterium]|nr:TIGR00730 family Rossman fold protein [Bacteroidales bacterium]
MNKLKNICVYCGSNVGNHNSFKQKAEVLGKLLAEKKITLVYGGANVGLMKILAETVLNNGGKAIGVITHFLSEKHLVQQGLSELILVNTMQERKAKMAELADGFIVLPGGIGTMEEFFEVLTSAQLGFHEKPIGLLNINGYYDLLLNFFDNMIKEKLFLPVHRSIVISENNPEKIIEIMYSYKAPKAGKWIEKIIAEN